MGRSRLSAHAWRGGRARRRAVLGLGACGVGTWETNSDAVPGPRDPRRAAADRQGAARRRLRQQRATRSTRARSRRASGTRRRTRSPSVDTPWDAFCAGHAQLARRPAARRRAARPATSRRRRTTRSRARARAYTFNPDDELPTERVANMTTARWYPTLLTLGDGSVLTLGGPGQRRPADLDLAALHRHVLDRRPAAAGPRRPRPGRAPGLAALPRPAPPRRRPGLLLRAPTRSARTMPPGSLGPDRQHDARRSPGSPTSRTRTTR